MLVGIGALCVLLFACRAADAARQARHARVASRAPSAARLERAA
jgi:hypothetical protein